MKFSSLDRNEKTFNLLCLYLKEISENRQRCCILDNRIQADEIRAFLGKNNKTPQNDLDVQSWIKEYSKEFRSMLNSVKLAAVLLLSQGITEEKMDWKCFCRIEETLNLYKGNCLDTIF